MIRVLIVDDQPDVRLAFRYMLEHYGCRITEAGNGKEALNCLSRERVDVVLTDLYMPGMDGLALLREILERPGPRPRVIAISGSPNLGKEASLSAARALGADIVLPKPLSRDQLITAIRSLMSGDVRRS